MHLEIQRRSSFLPRCNPGGLTLFLLMGAPLCTAVQGMAQAGISDCARATVVAHYKPIKSIDFSSRHNVMIRSQDGTLTPMDEPYYRSTQIAPGTWRIESDGDFSYLLEGDNEALAIDTGYGAGNIREYLQTLTKKPLRFVANTHDHFDHTANDAFFECAFMSAETAKKATIPFQSFQGMTFPRDYPKIIVGDGYKIQLGNREIETFIIPNHTAGGTAYLDKREHILFSGDEIFPRGNTISATGSVAQYERNMAKLEAHRTEFDKLATGGFGVVEAVWVDRYLANTQYILAGHEGTSGAQGGPGGPGGPGRPGGPGSGPGGTGGSGGPGGAPGQVGAASAAVPPGTVVYTRRFPRPGDSADPGGSGGPPKPNEYTRRMTYDDSTITYDIRHVQN